MRPRRSGWALVRTTTGLRRIFRRSQKPRLTTSQHRSVTRRYVGVPVRSAAASTRPSAPQLFTASCIPAITASTRERPRLIGGNAPLALALLGAQRDPCKQSYKKCYGNSLQMHCQSKDIANQLTQKRMRIAARRSSKSFLRAPSHAAQRYSVERNALCSVHRVRSVPARFSSSNGFHRKITTA